MPSFARHGRRRIARARYRAEGGTKDGRIARIGDLKCCTAAKELDAGSLVVAPGPIDLRTHYDAQIHWDPHCTIEFQLQRVQRASGYRWIMVRGEVTFDDDCCIIATPVRLIGAAPGRVHFTDDEGNEFEVYIDGDPQRSRDGPAAVASVAPLQL